jgi:Probable cobalt transporter subunit (CbtB)
VTTISTSPGVGVRVGVSPEALSKGRVIALLSVTVFLALAVYYLVGVDEGMTSLFGKSMVIHEWMHDARHFLGFPCH